MFSQAGVISQFEGGLPKASDSTDNIRAHYDLPSADISSSMEQSPLCPGVSLNNHIDRIQQPQVNISQSPEKCQQEPSYPSSSKNEAIEEPRKAILPPCKLARELATDLNADITQLSITAENDEKSKSPDSTGCLRAHNLLMQYATPETLERLSDVLDKGCVPNKGPGGGCSVRNRVLFEALDGVCL